MALFQKGQSGNPRGRAIERPFANALNDEIAAAGSDQVVLRKIARNLLRMAQLKRGMTALPAILALADRLDGRPATEATVMLTKREASDWTRDELVAFLRDATPQMREVIEAEPIAQSSQCLPSK